jgi:hypothetical protein
VTTHVRLVGAGADGLGEDVSVHAAGRSSANSEQLSFAYRLPHATPPPRPGFVELP